MKRIEAIIRKTKFEDVKEALLQSDIDWFEYHSVHGIGQSREERIYRGVQYSTDVIERVALTIVCRDPLVEPTVKVILKVAHTGEVGDGRIFVSDMIDTWSRMVIPYFETRSKGKRPRLSENNAKSHLSIVERERARCETSKKVSYDEERND